MKINLIAKAMAEIAEMFWAKQLVFIGILFFLFSIKASSQTIGSWKILDYFPEATQLSDDEINEMKKNNIGNSILIDSTSVTVVDMLLKGKLNSKIDTIKLINTSDIPDSLSYNIPYFCQELYSFNAITKETILWFNKNYNKNYICILKFNCNVDKVMNCVNIYFIGDGKIAFCMPGDGAYILIKEDKK